MDWDDRILGAFYFFVTGTIIFEPLGLVATVLLCPLLALIGFLVGGRTTASRARRGL